MSDEPGKEQLPSGLAAPVVIGGVGGSGTRLIARCLMELHWSMGRDLNRSLDNMWFTLLLKKPEILTCSDEEFGRLTRLMVAATNSPGRVAHACITLLNYFRLLDRPNVLKDCLQQAAPRLVAPGPAIPGDDRWGWKEPNSHVILDRLMSCFPSMKYIHVMRNGLDMAHSRNQQQLQRWGDHYLDESFDVSPRSSLKFWCAVHRRVIRHGTRLGHRFLLLNYDQFCLRPREGVSRLSDFLGVEPDRSLMASLVRLVQPPDSIGRFREYDTDIFDAQDVAYVRELGFDVSLKSQHCKAAA